MQYYQHTCHTLNYTTIKYCLNGFYCCSTFCLVLLPFWCGHVNWFDIIRWCSASQESTLRVSAKQYIQKGDTITCRSLTLHKTKVSEWQLVSTEHSGDHTYVRTYVHTYVHTQCSGMCMKPPDKTPCWSHPSVCISSWASQHSTVTPKRAIAIMYVCAVIECSLQ